MPMERHASRIVMVSGTCTDSPSILISVCLGSGCSGGAGVRLGLGGGVNQTGSDVLTDFTFLDAPYSPPREADCRHYVRPGLLTAARRRGARCDATRPWRQIP